MIWYFVGRMASLYGWKFVLLMLYIGQVAVPTLSCGALCEMGVLEDAKMSEDGRRHGSGQLRVRKPLGAQIVLCQKTRRASQKGNNKSPRELVTIVV